MSSFFFTYVRCNKILTPILVSKIPFHSESWIKKNNLACLQCVSNLQNFFPLTVMGHSQRQALLEATILALVTILLLNLAGTLTALIFQFHPHGSPEKALSDKTMQLIQQL